MAIRDIVTGGFGNGTFSGTIALVVTRGYAIGESAPVPDAIFFTNITLSLPTFESVTLSLPTFESITLAESPE